MRLSAEQVLRQAWCRNLPDGAHSSYNADHARNASGSVSSSVSVDSPGMHSAHRGVLVGQRVLFPEDVSPLPEDPQSPSVFTPPRSHYPVVSTISGKARKSTPGSAGSSELEVICIDSAEDHLVSRVQALSFEGDTARVNAGAVERVVEGGGDHHRHLQETMSHNATGGQPSR